MTDAHAYKTTSKPKCRSVFMTKVTLCLYMTQFGVMFRELHVIEIITNIGDMHHEREFRIPMFYMGIPC